MIEVKKKGLFEGGRIKPNQKKAAQLLAEGMSQNQAAEAIGVDNDTVSRWMKYDTFRSLIDKKADLMVEEAKKDRISNIDFFEIIKARARTKPVSTTDGIKAATELAKIYGEYSPQKKEIEIKQELNKLSKEQLQALKEANEAVSVISNRGGIKEEGE